MFKTPLFKRTLLMVATLLVIWLLGIYTEGKIGIGIALYGLLVAIRGRNGQVFATMLLVIFCVMLNPYVFPRDANFGRIAKVAVVLIPCLMIIGGRGGQGNEKLPLGAIGFFLVVAFLASMHGWVPLISYLKIVNFGVFLLGLYLVSKGLDRKPGDLFFARAFFIALAVLLVYGSLVSLAFPGVAYYTSLSNAVNAEGMAYAEDLYYNQSADGMTLFSGITIHSQFLGPALVCVAGLLLADMLLVEKKMSKLHLAILLPMPVMLYMTRARVGVLAFAVLGAVVLFYMMPRSLLDEKTRRHLKNMIACCAVLIVVACIYSEHQNQAISRLIRKNNDITDSRSLSEATTSSRMGLIAESMKDFNLNPMLGKGFQVSEQLLTKRLTHWQDFFSASIEKGLLPTMLLGEVGLLGTAVFVYFLWKFFTECKKRKYIATSSLMIVFLATNIGEATFFSPSGGGGFLWIVCVLGGFVVDMAVKAGVSSTGGAATGGPSVKVGIVRNCVRKDIKRSRIKI